jgi:hypothetical protein
MLFLGWIFLAVAVAMFANIRRNRNAFGWFLVSIFFSPLIGFILVAILTSLPAARTAVSTPRGDPRWANLRAGVDTAENDEAKAVAIAAKTIAAKTEQQAARLLLGGLGLAFVVIFLIVRLA